MSASLSVKLRGTFFQLMLKLPEFLIKPLGFGVKEVEGEPVSHKLRWLLRLLVVEPVDTPHKDKRAIYDYISTTDVAGSKMDVHVTDLEVVSDVPISVRIYRPDDSNQPLPTLLWLHGGGWVIGSIQSHDTFCRRLCKEAGIAVVSCDYRLSPENPFPIPEKDVTAVWQWVRSEAEAQGFDSNRLALGGDSAGGTLTSILCNHLPVEERPMFQILCYPGGDYTKSTASREKWAKGYLLDAELLEWFLNHYCPNEDRSNPKISPLLIPTFDNQPPAMVITAGMDSHLDEGRQYVNKFTDGGTPVDHFHIAPMIHGFITMYGALPNADIAVGEMIQRIKGHLQS